MNEGRALFLDLYELTMAQSYFLHRKGVRASFELFVRKLPARRSYLIAAGLQDILDFVSRLRFRSDDISFLRKKGIFSRQFLEYLSRLRFSGDIWAMPEGEVFFAGEPLIRVTAPIIEAQILESFLLNTINLQTMIASKASRVVSAAAGRGVFDFSLRRTHGFDAGLKAARSAYIAGSQGTSNCLAGQNFGIPVAGTMAHSFVLSFDSEEESFCAYASSFPARSILLVDTYNIKKGVENALRTGLWLKRRGYKLQGIRLDSGDIIEMSRYARKRLDRAGLGYVKILASGNLDEFKISKLISKGAFVDSFGVGTNMGSSTDAPSLDVIYKISEVTDVRGRYQPAMKLSKAKVTYPGRKQVFRQRDKKGVFIKDVLAIDGEDIEGQPLLRQVVSGGRQVYRCPGVGQIRGYCRRRLYSFCKDLRDIKAVYRYPVEISRGLRSLKASVCAKIRQGRDDNGKIHTGAL